MPLYEFRELEITSSEWQTVLKWDGMPDKIFYVDTFVISVDYAAMVTGECSIRVKLDGKIIGKLDNNAIDDEPSLYWFSMRPVQFKSVNPNGHLVFEAKADGTNAILATAEILGIQVDKEKKKEET